MRKDQNDWSYLLTSVEKQRLADYEQEYRCRFGTDPAQDPDLVFFLGDTAAYRTWSATSKRIPTYRRNGGKYWFPHHRRWLTAADKLSSLGFPINAESAGILGLTPLPLLDTLRASSICGNAMHLSNTMIMVLLAVSCFGPNKTVPSIDWDGLDRT